MKNITTRLALILLSASVVSGCAVTTAGIKKGDERNFVRSVNDVSAGRVIEARMKRAHDNKLGGVDVEVAEGVVLLSGNVPKQEDRIEAARIAWSAPRIEQVGNEIMIKGKQGWIRNGKDGILEKSVRTRLIADKVVKARNFNVETHDGIVYLMGVARTQSELERAARIASTTRGTKEVISYARIADMSAEQRMAAQQAMDYKLNPYRELPDFLTSSPTPQGTYAAPDAGAVAAAPIPLQQPQAPVQNLPLSAPIPFNAPTDIAGPTAPPQIDMGDRLGKELPTDEQLGAFRTGGAGEAVSIIESAPYYVDPETGEEIPVRYDANGNLVPQIIR